MSISQLKKELAGIREMLQPDAELGGVIIYDPDKGIPEFTDEKMRICIPDNGRDRVLIYIPEDGRDC